jgi:hypothetical protein
MLSNTHRWLLLGTALAASIIVAVLFRSADSLGENTIARHNDGVAETIEQLSKALQPDPANAQDLTNPFQKPAKAVAGEPAKPAQQPKSGALMTGWARLNNIDYALVATETGEKYVQVGDIVAGWRVTQVSSEQMLLTQGQFQEVVKLKGNFSVTPLN